MRQGVTNDSLAKYTRNKLVPEHGLPVDGDQFDLGFGLSNHLGRQRGVVQILGKLLAVVDAPPEEGHDGLRLGGVGLVRICLLYTSPSPRDGLLSRMPSSA